MRRAQTHVQNVLLRQKKQILRCILGRYPAVPQIRRHPEGRKVCTHKPGEIDHRAQKRRRQRVPAGVEEYSQFIDIFHGFLSRHIVDDGFTHRRKVSSCDHVMKLTSHAPGEHTVFSEEGVVFFGSIDLQLHQHLDEIRVARSLRPAENQLEFAEMVVHKRDKLVQVLDGKRKAVSIYAFSMLCAE